MRRMLDRQRSDDPRQPAADIANATRRLEQLGSELAQIYDRWTELSDRE